MSDSVLRSEGLSVHYGGVAAVVNFTMDVRAGKLVGLIGPNGAGKTSFIDAITGFTPSTGRVTLDGVDVSGFSPERRARLGVTRTWQSVDLFDELTIRENVSVASRRHAGGGGVFGGERADEVLQLLELQQHAESSPDTLTQGQRKLAGVARALAGAHKLVCLDEPAAGLDTHESRVLGTHLRRVVDDGTPMLLVDHDMGLVLSVCDYVYVLDFGKLVAEGTPDAIKRDERVIAAYLGTSYETQRDAHGAGRIEVAKPPPGAGPATTHTGEQLLTVGDLTAGYDGAPVLRGLDLSISAGEVVALVGANGAGKTTTLRAISGLVRPSSGSIELAGESIVGLAPQRITGRGVAHVPEERGIFPGLTVAEHFRLGARGERPDVELAFTYFPALAQLRGRRAGLLSGGEQQMLALACALARRPKLLMLDELSLGLAPVIVERLLPVVRQHADDGGAVLLVEQHLPLAFDVADRGIVLSHGEVMLQGSVDELANNSELLVASYMGERSGAQA